MPKPPRVRKANKDAPTLENFPNFSATGSVTGMRNLYYGQQALLVRKGRYIYNVSSEPHLYYQHAH